MITESLPYMTNAHTDRHNKANKGIFKLLLSTPQNRPNRLSKIYEMHEPGKCLKLTLIPYTIPYSGFQYCNHHKRTLCMTDYKIRFCGVTPQVLAKNYQYQNIFKVPCLKCLSLWLSESTATGNMLWNHAW